MKKNLRIFAAVVGVTLCGCLIFSCGDFENVTEDGALSLSSVVDITDLPDTSTPVDELDPAVPEAPSQSENTTAPVEQPPSVPQETQTPENPVGSTETEAPNETSASSEGVETPSEDVISSNVPEVPAETEQPIASETSQEPEQTEEHADPPEQQTPERHEHRLEYAAAVAATCIQDGNVEHYHCAECGNNYSDANGENELSDITVPAAGHRYSETIIDPTCTSAGYTLHKCDNCDDEYTNSETEATGHNYAETVIDPTCTSAGYTLHKCDNCDDEYTNSETEALGHEYGAWSELDEDRHGRECERCEHTESAEHNMSGDKCSDCEYEIVREYEYSLNADGKGYTIVGIGNITDTKITFPATYNNLPVTAIVEGAFQNNTNITSVEIPKNIVKIGKNAFLGCTNLKSVEFKNKSGWKISDTENGTKKAFTLGNAATNAEYLTNNSKNTVNHYAEKYWWHS